jgi:ferredoxin-thioredoxin reductase catalytic subunit
MTTIDKVRQRAEADARTYGYYLNPDPKFLQNLLEGLKQNEERYSYPSCPCRLASGKFEYDRDILCPCDYRDADVQEFGACYCGLYVRKDIHEGKAELKPIPERRPVEKQARAYGGTASPATAVTQNAEPAAVSKKAGVSAPEKKLWYCKQCGYVVFRDAPPYVCPICKAKKELFKEITVGIEFSG